MCDRLLGVHVLVVSAVPTVPHARGRRLEGEGASALVPDTARDATELARAHSVDTAVIEPGLPDIDHALVIAALARQAPTTKRVVVISGVPGQDLPRAIAAGAARVFTSPLDWDRLLWYREAGPRPGGRSGTIG